MKATLLKRLDTVLGPLITRLLWKRRDFPAHTPPRSILFIRPGGIGDAILLAPALRAVQAAYPGCHVDLLAERRNASAFLLSPGWHKIYRYDSPSELSEVLGKCYDVVVDTEQWYRLSAVVARIVHAPKAVGFATNERARLFTHPVSYSLQEYEAISFLGLLRPLGIEPPETISVPYLTLPPAAVQAAEALLSPLGGKPFVAIFPGSSVAEKEWGAENYRLLASALVAAGIAVVIVGGADTREAGDRIAGGGVALNLAGQGSLATSAAVIGAAKLLVSGDSGLLHIAAGLGKPTVSLFGPSDPVKWAPKGEGHQVFSTELPCAPCSRFGTVPRCGRPEGCMDADPVKVAEAVIRSFTVVSSFKQQ
ncbi:MAG TPA: glycosyltransferase family 9 protein [Geobacter sp.]|nr:glycosyltransferase family 9 protein [Geobacter sp.]